MALNFSKHDTVNHQEDQYVRYWNEETGEKRLDGKPVVETTVITTESYFSVFKRGMLGTYQHCSEKHLHRYLAEFDFRHDIRTALGVNDGERASELAKGIVGSASPIDGLTKDTFKHRALRFVRWRKKHHGSR